MEGDSRPSPRIGARVTVCDGAMGTMLHSAGVPLGRALCELNLTQPELVRDLHAAYVAAGADIIQTNTFDANRVRLSGGDAKNVAEINIAGARLAREAARSGTTEVRVAGSVGPVMGTAHTGRMGRVDRASVLSEQIAALTNWVDLLMLETFGDLPAMIEAVRVARSESDLPIIAQMTFSTDGHTLAGESPAEVGAALSELDVVAIGANCTVGPASLRDVVAQLSASCMLPVSVQPNAGMPHRAGGQLRYTHNTAYFADETLGFIGSGAAIVGGCCGTTPAHIRAITQALADVDRARPVVVPPKEERGAEGRRPFEVGMTPEVASTSPEPDWPETGEFAVIAGLQAPRGHDLAAAVAHAQQLNDAGADMLAMADPDPPAARVNPVAAGVLLQERVQARVVLSIEAADRTLAALQADLLGAHALGLRVVVCHTGTPRVAGDYPEPGSLWDVDSTRLIAVLAGLNDGIDWRGVSAPERTRFVIGATVHTAAADIEALVANAEKKVRAGAHFLLTDPVHDIARTERNLIRLREQVTVPVIAVLAPFDDSTTLVRSADMRHGAVSATTGAHDVDDDAARLQHCVTVVEKLQGLLSGVLVRTSRADARLYALIATLRATGGPR